VTLSAFTYIGITFKVGVAGRLFGIAMYERGGVGSAYWGIVTHESDSVVVAAKHFDQSAMHAGGGWRRAWLHKAPRLVVGDFYRVAIIRNNEYQRTVGALAAPVTHSDITYQSSWQTTSISGPLASISTNTNANGIDVMFYHD
jgi:hypothetical protein